MLTSLNKEQRSLMVSVRDEWINYALNLPKGEGGLLTYTPPPPIKNLRENVDWLYGFYSLPSPYIIEVESPLGLQLAANWGPLLVEAYLAVLTKQAPDAKAWDQVWGQVWGQVSGQVSGQVWGQVGGQVWGQVGGQVWDQVWDQVSGQVWDQVSGQVWDQVSGQVGGQVWGQVSGQVWDQVWGQVSGQVSGQVWGQVGDQVWGNVADLVRGQHSLKCKDWGLTGLAMDSGWTAFYDFFDRLGMIKSPAFDAWRRFVQSGIWDCILLQGMAIVCRRPLAVRRDARNRLHCLDKPAIEWADGFKLHYVSGVHMPAATIERPDTITVERILGEENAEIRKGLIQIRGEGWFLGQTKAKILDEDSDLSGMPRRLFKFHSRNTSWCVLEVECPSKRDKHYLWVPPSMTRCSQACAWTFGFDVPDQYRPLVEA